MGPAPGMFQLSHWGPREYGSCPWDVPTVSLGPREYWSRPWDVPTVSLGPSGVWVPPLGCSNCLIGALGSMGPAPGMFQLSHWGPREYGSRPWDVPTVSLGP
ncbi:hypothetical protein XENTR_v10010457 [Xenopus tropicalis]|nr:hypothetical protein XENTR_v10010457 [Xenopus tropicalis]